jgi:hypothetical protein
MDQSAIKAFAQVLVEIHLHVEACTGDPNRLLGADIELYDDVPRIDWIYGQYETETSKKVIRAWYKQIEKLKTLSWSINLLMVGGATVVDHARCKQSSPLVRLWSHYRIVEGLVADALLRAKLFMLVRQRARTEGSSVKNLPLDICKEILWHANQCSNKAL